MTVTPAPARKARSLNSRVRIHARRGVLTAGKLASFLLHAHPDAPLEVRVRIGHKEVTLLLGTAELEVIRQSPTVMFKTVGS